MGAALPVTNTKDYQRIRSRLFRLSFADVFKSAFFWNPQAQTVDIRKFSLLNIEAMSRITESCRPVEVRVDASFMEVLSAGRSFAIDFDLYRSLSRAERRFYLIANREGWNIDSLVFRFRRCTSNSACEGRASAHE